MPDHLGAHRGYSAIRFSFHTAAAAAKAGAGQGHAPSIYFSCPTSSAVDVVARRFTPNARVSGGRPARDVLAMIVDDAS